MSAMPEDGEAATRFCVEDVMATEAFALACDNVGMEGNISTNRACSVTKFFEPSSKAAPLWPLQQSGASNSD